jgi:hypothetical protein
MSTPDTQFVESRLFDAFYQSFSVTYGLSGQLQQTDTARLRISVQIDQQSMMACKSYRCWVHVRHAEERRVVDDFFNHGSYITPKPRLPSSSRIDPRRARRTLLPC